MLGKPSPTSTGFRCPDCEGATEIRDVRSQIDGTVLRMRHCKGCHVRFLTEETFHRYALLKGAKGQKFGWCHCECHQAKHARLLKGVECDRCHCTPVAERKVS